MILCRHCLETLEAAEGRQPAIRVTSLKWYARIRLFRCEYCEELYSPDEVVEI